MFFHWTIAQTVRGIYLKDIILKGFERSYSSVSSPWCYTLQVFIHSWNIFCASLFVNDMPYLAKLRQRKVTTQSGKNVILFCFCFIVEFSFYMQKPGIYADLLRFQSRVKNLIQIILMKRIILFFIHSYHVLTFVY